MLDIAVTVKEPTKEIINELARFARNVFECLKVASMNVNKRTN